VGEDEATASSTIDKKNRPPTSGVGNLTSCFFKTLPGSEI